MKLLEKILVATDFSHAAEDAVRMADYVAQHFQSKVYLLHVKTPSDEPAARLPADLDQVISERLDSLARQMVDHGARSVESVLLEGQHGREGEAIARYAEEQDVNVIMIGAGEVAAGRQFFLGTCAARLRRRAPKPVWIVRPGTAPPIRRILCPVDFLPAAARALSNAVHFARTFDAELTVLTVTQSPLGDYDTLLERESPTERAAEEPPTCRSRFEEFLRNYDFHQVRYETVIRQGRPRYEVANVAREKLADLIVMGSVGRTGLSRMLIGGVARRVAQELPCSIITVRSQEPIRLALDREIPPPNKTICSTLSPDQKCERCEHGERFLDQGLADKAILLYQGCVGEYRLCTRAWQRLAEAHVRLGQHEKAQQCEASVEESLRELRNLRLEEEVRGGHILHRKMFGI